MRLRLPMLFTTLIFSTIADFYLTAEGVAGAGVLLARIAAMFMVAAYIFKSVTLRRRNAVAVFTWVSAIFLVAAAIGIKTQSLLSPNYLATSFILIGAAFTIAESGRSAAAEVVAKDAPLWFDLVLLFSVLICLANGLLIFSGSQYLIAGNNAVGHLAGALGFLYAITRVKHGSFALFFYSIVFFSVIISQSRLAMVVWLPLICLMSVAPKSALSKLTGGVASVVGAIFVFFSVSFLIFGLFGGESRIRYAVEDTQVEWRGKGGGNQADIRRLFIFPDYAKRSIEGSELTGNGFGDRSYRELLPAWQREFRIDIHSAYLIMLVEGGWILFWMGVVTLVILPSILFAMEANIHKRRAYISMAVVYASANFFVAPLYGSQAYGSLILLALLVAKQRTIQHG